ncbi:MAG: hypothetical protein RLZZ623_2482 [Actinomycetota bacterium]
MRRFSVILATLALTVGFAGTAHANGGGGVYPPTKPTTGVSSGVIAPGTGFTIYASGFCPGQPISFVLAGGGNYFWSVPVIADAGGNASYFVNPADIPAAGISYTVYAKIISGPCAGQNSTTTITVLPYCSVTRTENGSHLCVDTGQGDGQGDGQDDCLETSGLTFSVNNLPPCPPDANDLKPTDGSDSKTTKQPDTTEQPDNLPPQIDNGRAGSQFDLSVTTTVAVAALAPVVSTGVSSPSVTSPAVSVPASVLSAGLVSSAVQPAAAGGAAAAVPLPRTGSEPSHTLQIALVALTSGLGMLGVAGMRRRKQAGSSNSM